MEESHGEEFPRSLWWCHFGMMVFQIMSNSTVCLTYWGRVTHICVSNSTIIGSDNGLSPYRRQAITWTNDGILLIGPLGTNFSEILIAILAFSFKEMHLKVSSAKRRPFCLNLNVLTHLAQNKMTVFRRRNFEMHFRELNVLYFNSNFT